jgi:LysM repeat protein
VIHQVQSGQSLWSIAIKYGVKIDSIRRLNNISPEGTIYMGQKLIIKSPGSNTPMISQVTETPSMSDFLPSRAEAQIVSTPSPIPTVSPPHSFDPTGLFLFLFVLCGAGLVLVFIGMNR